MPTTPTGPTQEVLVPLKGFSVPLSPEGRASLTPVPPWHYAGEVLAIDFVADPAAVQAVLPPHLERDPRDPGGCVAFFVAWQYASECGDEYLDPARSGTTSSSAGELSTGTRTGEPRGCHAGPPAPTS
jgi:hypothetical protein